VVVKQVCVSGLSGQQAGEEHFAKLIVHDHPQYLEPIDVLPDEIGELPDSEQYVSIEVVQPVSAADSWRCCRWIGSTSWPLPCERKHRHLVTRGSASIAPLTLAFAVVVCRLLPADCRVFAACGGYVLGLSMRSVTSNDLGTVAWYNRHRSSRRSTCPMDRTTIREERSLRVPGIEPVPGVRAARRLAWSLWLPTVVLLALGAWLEALNASTRGSPWQQSLGLVPLSLPFATFGALIATRQRHNPIGWLLCGFGLVVAVLLVGNQYSRYALVTAPGSLPAGDWAAWLAVWPVELTALLSILVLSLFPDGQSLSPRWRPLVWLAVTLGMVNAATQPCRRSTSPPMFPSPTIPSSCSTRGPPEPSTTPARPCSWAFSWRLCARS
jgi:hypothetical protein